MPRKGPVPKRDVLPDPVYNSKLVTRFINKVMYDGKKGIAETIVYDAFEIIRSKMGQDPMEVFDQALKMLCLYLKYVLAVSVVRTTKCQLKFVLIAVKHSVFAGL